MAIAGKDFCVVASDTRMSTGYSIHSRNNPKFMRVTDKVVLVTCGMQADRATFFKTLRARAVMYEHKMGRPMSFNAVAQQVSTMLYYKRFFPYYTFNIVAGVDDDGLFKLASYDAVGSFSVQMNSAAVLGSGSAMIQPLLDDQVDFKNQTVRPDRELNAAEMVDLIKDAFTSAGERDIYTGDHVDIHVIQATGITHERFDLKLD